MGQTELKNMQRRVNAQLQRWFDEAESAEAIENWLKWLYGDHPVLAPAIGEHRFVLHFKTLRHTYCTELYDLGIDEVSAAAIMGHTVTVMREIYTHIQKERKIQTIQRIEGLYGDKLVPLPALSGAEKSG